MNKIILLIIFSILASNSFAQCKGQIYLSSQDDIDAFPSKYNHCSEFDSIWIGISPFNILNLDSLYNLKKGKLLSISGTDDSLKSISGLNNLQTVTSLYLGFKKNYPKLQSLDTVEILQYFNVHTDANLNVISNIKHIARALNIASVKNLSGLDKFTCSDNFNLSLNNVLINNNFINILPANIRKLNSLSLYACNGLSLVGLEQIDSIYSLELIGSNYLERNVFAQKKGIKRLKFFYMYPNYLDALPQIDTLEFLHITSRINLEKTFPNLKHVSEFLRITNYDSLTTMDFFKDFDIPRDKRKRVELEYIYDVPYHIIIAGNKNLKECNNAFLCKALEAYLDSIIIDNTGDCKLNYLKDNCEGVNTDEENNISHTIIYPNPVKDIFEIKSESRIVKCSIYNLQGSLVLQTKDNTKVDVSQLQPGLYVVSVFDGVVESYYRIIKE